MWSPLEIAVNNFALSIMDPSISETALTVSLNRVLELRRQVLKGGHQPGIEMSTLTAEERVVEVMVALLSNAPDHRLPISTIGSHEHVKTARAAAKLQLNTIISRNPELFSVSTVPHSTPGKSSYQEVTLLQIPEQPASGTLLLEDAKSRLLARIVEVLESMGSTAYLSLITGDEEVRTLRKGNCASISKFLQSFPELFELFDAPNADPTKNAVSSVRLLRGPSDSHETTLPPLKRRRLQAAELPARRGAPLAALPAPAEGSVDARREELSRCIQKLLENAPEGAIRIDDLAQEPTIMQLRKGVVSKFLKFFTDQAHIFNVYDALDEKGKVVKCISLSGKQDQ